MAEVRREGQQQEEARTLMRRAAVSVTLGAFARNDRDRMAAAQQDQVHQQPRRPAVQDRPDRRGSMIGGLASAGFGGMRLRRDHGGHHAGQRPHAP